MTVKIFSSGDWSDVPVDQHQIKVASVGLGPTDKRAALKFASGELLDWLDKLPLRDDCVYVHKIAMGGSHRYGPNRWGDGFREEVLANDHRSFETDAKAYRQHKSDGPHYGHVKLARFSERTGLVELVTEYYATDEAAKANKGKLADLEIENLSKKGYIPVSMGSYVPGDSCSVCGHWAPKPADRCSSKSEGGNCTLFGCKTGMLKVAEDGQLQYVDNPKNRFYDISMVGTGADPVANGVLLPLGKMAEQVSRMRKVASFAESTITDLQPLSELEELALSLGYKWAEFEMEPVVKTASDAGSWSDTDLGYATHSPAVSTELLSMLHSRNVQTSRDSFSELHRRRLLPDYVPFAKAAGLSDLQVEATERFIPNLFTHLVASKQLLPVVKLASSFRVSKQNNVQSFAMPTIDGVDSQSVLRRTLVANANGIALNPRKVASFSECIPEIAARYAAFKLAYFTACETVDPQSLYGIVRRDLYSRK